MRTRLLTVLAVLTLTLALPRTVAAQNATPTNKLGWNQQGAPDLPTAQAYTYKYYADAATTGVTLSAVTCTLPVAPDTTGFSCTVAFPSFTPGSHALAVTASNAAGESAKSAALNFVMVLVPSAPATLRIQ